ncbi:NACHT domain-containing protein [Promicromonospora alba]|uniref:NACHT domain-containing protein n=1 Tax=Promicromonospora alba TaxID=1616110 RepID=A0ABV9HKK5_9MICO
MELPIKFESAVRLLAEQDKSLADRLWRWARIIATSVEDPAVALVSAAKELGELKRDVLSLARSALGSKTSSGDDRPPRRDVLLATHSLIVLSSFFETLDERLTRPIPILKLSEREKLTIATESSPSRGTLKSLIEARIPYPDPSTSMDLLADNCEQYFVKLGEMVLRFFSGLEAWNQLSRGAREELVRELSVYIPQRARDRYEHNFARLCSLAPEYLIWTQFRQHSMLLRQIAALDESLQIEQLTESLQRVEAGMAATQRTLQILQNGSGAGRSVNIERLNEINRIAANGPLVPVRDTSGLPVASPSLKDAYQSPMFRVDQHTSDARESDDSWWNERQLRDDFDTFITGYLCHPLSTRAPLLVLGRPGSGKSAWTRVCAATVGEGGMVGIRIALRDVSPELTIQQLIEFQLREDLGRATNWADFLESAQESIPVVLFDGLDEYLLVTGSDEVDFLTRIQDFQVKWESIGHPIIAVVTSRTVVAARSRVPGGTFVLRLESFDEKRIVRWVEAWNVYNTDSYLEAGRDPLSSAAILRQSTLAREPILLLMMALLDAHGPALDAGDRPLARSELYERLLGSFLRREAERSEQRVSSRIEIAVEERFTQLGVASLGMSARGRQGLFHEELAADLERSCMMVSDSYSQVSGDVDAATRLVEAFFFIHESRAHLPSSGSTSQVVGRYYEFVHPTFSEYLLARLVLKQLSVVPIGISDAESLERLEMIFGASCFSAQPEVLNFCSEIAETGATWVDIPFALERAKPILEETAAVTSAAGNPALPRSGQTLQHIAVLSANLVGVTVELTGRVEFDTLVSKASADIWQRMAHLWAAMLPSADWFAFASRYDVVTEQGVISIRRREVALPISRPLEAELAGASILLNQNHVRLLEFVMDLDSSPARDISTAILSDYTDDRAVAQFIVRLAGTEPQNIETLNRELPRLKNAAVRTGLLGRMLRFF